MPYVRPDVQAVLSLLAAQPGPAMHEQSPAEARLGYLGMVAMAERPRGELGEVRDFHIPAAHGHAIPARLYRPTLSSLAAPVVVFFHGGGWVIGDLETHDALCADIARGLGLSVLSVDYRLAPEHPFPAAAEDAIAATRWLAMSPAEIGHPVTGLIPAGDSAGGNLAAVVSVELHGKLAVPIIAQWLIYPGVDMNAAGGSLSEFGEGHVLTADVMAWFMNHYLPPGTDRSHPHASPLHAPSLAGQPPTLVFTCSLDPLRDQGRAFAGRLIAAGVRTIFREAEGQVHGSATLRAGIPSAHDDLLANLADLRVLIAEASAAAPAQQAAA